MSRNTRSAVLAAVILLLWAAATFADPAVSTRRPETASAASAPDQSTGTPPAATPTASPTSFRIFDLQVTVDDSRDPVRPGEVITYVVRVDNNGPNLMTLGASLRGSLAPEAGVRFTGNYTATAGFVGSCQEPDHTSFSCSYQAFTAQSHVGEVHLEAKVLAEAAAPLELCAIVSYSPPMGGHDTNPDNNHDCEQTGVWSGTGTPPTPRPTGEPTPRSTPTPTCATHTTSMELFASDTEIDVGDLVTVTARLSNIGCAPIGLPGYRLTWQGSEPHPMFDPPSPRSAYHQLGIGTGQHDDAHFVLRAVRPGVATFNARVSFEVHLGYPGPAYWAGDSAGPLSASVTSEQRGHVFLPWSRLDRPPPPPQ